MSSDNCDAVCNALYGVAADANPATCANLSIANSNCITTDDCCHNEYALDAAIDCNSSEAQAAITQLRCTPSPP